ncbi:hypothetical protein ACT7CT_24910 [Bacillus sanguinis]
MNGQQKGLPARLDGTFENHLAYDTVVRFLEESRGRQIVTMKLLVEKFKDVPYGWSENDIAGMVAAALYNKKFKLMYLNESFDTTNSQFIARITKASEREKVVIEAQIGIPSRVRKEVIETMRELFNFYDIGETYDEVAKSIRNQIQKHFIELIEDMQRTKQREDQQYPYPGGIVLSKIKNSIVDLLAITKQENFVEEFVELDEDLEEWLEDVQHLNSFYNGNAIRHFDESVRVLKERRDDLDVAQHDVEVQKVKNSIVSILTSDNPYHQIPNLPILNEQLKQGLSKFVQREIGTQLKQMEAIRRDMENLQTRYKNIDAIKEVVQEKIAELQKRVKQMQDLESISRVYTYTQMANNDYHRLEERVKELYKSYVDDQDDPEGTDQIKIVEMSVSQLVVAALPGDQLEIENIQGLKQWLKKLEDTVNEELNQGKTVRIKKIKENKYDE